MEVVSTQCHTRKMHVCRFSPNLGMEVRDPSVSVDFLSGKSSFSD